MSIQSVNVLFSRRAKAILVIAGLVASLSAVLVPTTNATAAPSNPDKVTICHRTHSTGNPYRMITVSKSSVDGPLNVRSSGNSDSASGDHAGIVHNKHVTGGSALTTWDPNFPIYNQSKTNGANGNVVEADNPVRVFDPNYVYSPNAKMWEDIIPPFTSNGVDFAGLNWTEKGKAIYYGLTLNGVNYAGLCKKMGSREYYDSEVGTGPGQGGQTANDVLDDIKDQGNTEQDGTFSGRPSLNELKSDPPSNKGPKKPTKLNDLLSSLAATNNNRAPSAMTQAIAGVVWFDNNRDGVQDNTETLAAGVGIVLKDPSGNLYTVGYKKGQKNQPKSALFTATKGNLFSFAPSVKNTATQLAANVITVTTDADGYFQFPSVPEGEWQVVVVTPAGYSYTYDSSGSSDGIMPGTLVPAGGVGFAWAGLVTQAQIDSENAAAAAAAAALANTGLSSTGWIAGAVALQLIGVGAVLIWFRRRRG